MAIDVNIIDGGRHVDAEFEQDITDILSYNIQSLCDDLIAQPSKFNKEDFADKLTKYIEIYERILYTPISNFIYTCYEVYLPDEAEQLMHNITGNIGSVLKFVNSENYKRKVSNEKDSEKKKALQDTKKYILKIYDHVNLAINQYHSLKQTDDEFRTKFDAQFDEAFGKRFDPKFEKEFTKKMAPEKEKLTKEMNAQLITMVGIFTALAFLIFGGISSLDNLFTNQSISIPRLMIIGSVWGLCILNLVFVFFILRREDD